MNKKKIITLCLVVCLIVTAVAGVSLAYFTDTKSAENTFTLGNVKIELLESSLHRQNPSGTLASDLQMEGDAKERSEYQTSNNLCYTDAQIEENAKTYDHTDVKLLPGQSYHKMPYVKNTGDSNAYIRIRVMIPSAANNDNVAVKDGGVITSMWTTSAMYGEFAHDGYYNDNPKSPMPFITTYTVDGMEYDVHTFYRIEPLTPGEMTYWNVWGLIGLAKDADTADIQKAIDAGALDKDGNFKILVEADAIQSDGFTDTTDKDGTTHTALENAWAAFDKQKAATP